MFSSIFFFSQADSYSRTNIIFLNLEYFRVQENEFEMNSVVMFFILVKRYCTIWGGCGGVLNSGVKGRVGIKVGEGKHLLENL